MIGQMNLQDTLGMKMLLLLLLGVCWNSVEAGTSNDFPYTSCKDIKSAMANAPSGEYSLRTTTWKILNKVYCEMGLNGGGYTFIHPSDLTRLTASELQSMFTDTTTFLLRFRLTDGTQSYGVLKQLSQYSATPLNLNLNAFTSYVMPFNAPPNTPNLGNPYLYFGFLPTSTSTPVGSTQGLQVNGVNVPFVNCDGNKNSYIALFPDFSESSPTTYLFSSTWPMFTNLVAAMKQNPSRRVMPDDYFMFFEMHFGGCGMYVQSDGRPSTAGIISASIGFR